MDFIDDVSYVYLAPETLSGIAEGNRSADVFSLGCIAFFIFAGQPPARGVADLQEKLQRQKGLLLSSVLDGALPELDDLIYRATNPDAIERIGSVPEFLDGLSRIESLVLSPSENEFVHPLKAKSGDTLEGGFEVKNVLGKGGTGVAFAVTHDDEDYILKVARSVEDNERILAEAKTLKQLQSEFIVRYHRTVSFSGLEGILLQADGYETLAHQLRKQGRFNLDLLQRFGKDLLEALKALESQGVSHRDIKPDNISIRDSKKRRTLVLLIFHSPPFLSTTSTLERRHILIPSSA